MIGFAPAVASLGTKSPSSTIAALGVFGVSTAATDCANVLWSAAEVPPAMFCVSPMICDMYVSALITDGSVHLILCWLSWSYFVGPPERR